MIPALGPSQTAILAWLKEHPGSTSREVGVALYDTVSSCSPQNNRHLFPNDPPLRAARDSDKAQWASRILQNLKKRGLVGFSDINNPKWKVVEEMEE
jgi:hypothetical protein